MASGGNNCNDVPENQLIKTSNLSQTHNPQEAVIAKKICFVTNFTELEITKIQVNYWGPDALWPVQPKFSVGGPRATWPTLQGPHGVHR